MREAENGLITIKKLTCYSITKLWWCTVYLPTNQNGNAGGDPVAAGDDSVIDKRLDHLRFNTDVNR